MRRRFTDEELAILTVCERNGWTYAQWFALSENEQIDRLAILHRRNTYLESILNGFDRRVKDGKDNEQMAYIFTLLERFVV